MEENKSLVSSSLSDRKKQILRSIIESHITNGEPVGSKTIMNSANIPFSSATIRSEMADLENLGFLEQLHTSSGRVPTKLGYRFYVDCLMEDYQLTANEIVTLNNLIKNKFSELDNILQNASKLVASITNYSTISIKAPSSDKVIESFSHMYLDEFDFLVVMKLPSGKVKTAHIVSQNQLTEKAVEKLIGLFNTYLANKEYDAITLPMIVDMEQKMEVYSFIVSPTIKAVFKEIEKNKTEVHFEGVDKLLKYPEFSNAEQMQKVFDMMENKDEIIGMATKSDNNVNVVINEENEFANNSSFIFKKVTIGGNVVGAIGVFGPNRMDYSKVVSTIEYLANKLSELDDTKQLNEGT